MRATCPASSTFLDFIILIKVGEAHKLKVTHYVIFPILLLLVLLSLNTISSTLNKCSFGIALGYGLDNWGSRVRFP
jgi:hypothetical protein